MGIGGAWGQGMGIGGAWGQGMDRRGHGDRGWG